MDKNKGYLLPPGDAYTEDMACTLVFYPDKPEYRRALGGSLAYLATWIAWEKESTHSGIDAALSWKMAYDLTMDCWNMACLEELQNNVAAILEIMQAGNQCCDEQDITDGDRYTDRVTDGVGDVPQNIIDAGYADDAADWDGFDDYKCMISHVIVDQIDARLIEYAKILTDYGPAAGTLAAVAGVFAVIFSTAGLAIVFGMVMGVGAVAFLYENLLGFPLLDDIIEKVQDNHEELACAVYQGDGDEGSLIALFDKIDELFTTPEAVLLKSVNLGPTLKALYAGRYDQQDIAQELADAGYDVENFDCECLFPIGEYQETWSWSANGEDWTGFETGLAWDGAWGNPGGGIGQYHSGPTQPSLRYSIGYAAIRVGKTSQAGDELTLHRISLDVKQQPASSGQLRLTIGHDSTTTVKTMDPGTDWVHYSWDFDPPLVQRDGRDDWLFTFVVINGIGKYHFYDNFHMDFDADFD